jgi:hypothetical protein
VVVRIEELVLASSGLRRGLAFGPRYDHLLAILIAPLLFVNLATYAKYVE